jgi:hypothetical protein
MTESFKEKIKNDFADTLVCAFEQLNGEEVFNCFRKAVTEHRIYTTKEYKKSEQLSEFISFT